MCSVTNSFYIFLIIYVLLNYITKVNESSQLIVIIFIIVYALSIDTKQLWNRKWVILSIYLHTKKRF